MIRRVSLILVILITQAWVPVGFGATEYADSPFLDADDLANNYESHIGEEAVVYGQIISVSPTVIRNDLGEDRQTFRITGLSKELRLGQYLEVYGIVRPEQNIAAKGSVIRGEREHWYTYGVSALAVLVVLARIVRDWRVDVNRAAIVPRLKN